MGSVTNKRSPSITQLKRISNPMGDILHGLKNTDDSYISFGEAYFTYINFGNTKGWKKHLRMTLNLIVPIGTVRFIVHDDVSSETKSYVIGEEDYNRLTVPPGYWVAFEGLTEPCSLVLNIASIPHDPSESLSIPLNSFCIP